MESWWKYDIYWLLKSSCFDLFGNEKYSLSWAKKVAGKMTFTDYWKVLVLTFSGMGNTVFFESKSWWKVGIRWLLKSSCFDVFGNWEIGSFLRQKVDGKMIFTGCWEILVLNFSVMGNTAFFQLRSWWKDDIYLVFLSFLWYSRTWEIWFFAQCVVCISTTHYRKKA